MKNKFIIISLFAALLSAGCSQTADKSNSTVAESVDSAQNKAKDAATDLKIYTYEKKSEFVGVMNKQLVDLEKNIGELSDKIEKSSDKVKAEAKPKLAALKEQATALKLQIAEIAKATPTTWDGIKADSDKAYNSLKNGVSQSRQWLADKIAP